MIAAFLDALDGAHDDLFPTVPDGRADSGAELQVFDDSAHSRENPAAVAPCVNAAIDGL